MDRNTFIKNFVSQAQQNGLSTDQTDTNLQSALKEYDAQSGQSNSQSTGSQQDQGNGFLNFLGAIASPFTQWGHLMGGMLNDGTGGKVGFGQKLTPQEETSMANPTDVMNNPIYKDVAGLASFAIPFGKGGNIATKVLAPGAATGALQAASENGSTPQSIATGAVVGAPFGLITNLAGQGTGKVLNKVGNQLQETGDRIISSQYKGAQPTLLRNNNLQGTIQDLRKYGLTNIDDIAEKVPQVTGSNGIVNNMVESAVANSGPVDVGGIRNLGRELINNGNLIDQHQASKFTARLAKGVSNMASDTSPGNADPEKALQFIRDFESQGQQYAKDSDTATRELGKAYLGVAGELKNRLFNGLDQAGNATGQGANQMVYTPTEQELQQLHQINPKLATAVANAKNVNELRAIEAPFVRASKMINSVSDNAAPKPVTPIDALMTVFGGLKGLAAMGAVKAVNSNVGKSTIGGGVAKAGEHMTGMQAANSEVQKLLDLLSAKTGGAIGGSISQPTQ